MHRELRRPEAEDKSQGRSCGASCNAIDRRQAAQPAVLLALELNAAIAALVARSTIARRTISAPAAARLVCSTLNRD
jgi:hypothetical protein